MTTKMGGGRWKDGRGRGEGGEQTWGGGHLSLQMHGFIVIDSFVRECCFF